MIKKSETELIGKRKEILPSWIRFFSWIFLIMFFVPILFIGALILDDPYSLRMFGFSYSGDEVTFVSLLLAFIMTLSAVVAYGILWGKDWAIKVGIFYAICALLMCFTSLYISITNEILNIQFEPIFLIPFLIVLIKRNKQWDEW